jgi:hypothetical protein
MGVGFNERKTVMKRIRAVKLGGRVVLSRDCLLRIIVLPLEDNIAT